MAKQIPMKNAGSPKTTHLVAGIEGVRLMALRDGLPLTAHFLGVALESLKDEAPRIPKKRGKKEAYQHRTHTESIGSEDR